MKCVSLFVGQSVFGLCLCAMTFNAVLAVMENDKLWKAD